MPKPIFCQIDDVLDQRLRTFMSVTGNSLTAVVRRAITNHIKNETRRNRGLKKDFDEEEAKVLASAGIPQLRLRRRPRKKVSGDISGTKTETA